VFVENVGNLVCPALFDLGEACRVVVMSVTEGADKPAKYPHMFRTADLVLVNKVDLLEHLDFDLEQFLGNLDAVNRGVEYILTSARTGRGVEEWCSWLERRKST
jgi:hydrogenase nickel incorporation protein HypB